MLVELTTEELDVLNLLVTDAALKPKTDGLAAFLYAIEDKINNLIMGPGQDLVFYGENIGSYRYRKEEE